MNPRFEQIAEIFGQFLSAEADFFGGNPGSHGAVRFVTGRGIDMKPGGGKHFQNGRIRSRLHRITSSEPERIGKSKHVSRIGLQRNFVVDVNRSAKLLRHCVGGGVIEKAGL